MARMIPSYVDSEQSPPGEVEVFELLRVEGPEDWIVLHSLDLPQHVRQVEGEIDFLILAPGGAVVCLEVKSHERVSRDSSGLWHLGSQDGERRGPFRQASEGMRSAKNRLSHMPGLKSVPFVSLVGFPRCPFDVPAVEWEHWQVFDEPALRQLGIRRIIERTCREARAKFAATQTASWFREVDREPTTQQCQSISKVLRPVFERQRSPKQRRAESQAELRHYTEEQFSALDCLDGNDRILFTGAAGTGKTFLALEALRRGVGSGERTLLCCFNKLLGRWLCNEADPLAGRAQVGTLHKLMLEIAEISVEGEGNEPGFWSEELPALVTDQLLKGHDMAASFDLVVIDEAQDICTGPFLDVIDLLLRDGLSHGRIRAFGDFEHQAIYSEGDGQRLLEDRTSGIVRYGLSENCRNRPRIGHLVGSFAGPEAAYGKFRRKDDGVEIDIFRSGKDQSPSSALEKAIDRLRADGHQLGDITILSPFRSGAAFTTLNEPYAGWLTSAEHPQAGKIRTSTIHAFKGMESPAVIVTDIRRVDREGDRQLLYIAASRATDRLGLIVDDGARMDLAEIIVSGGYVHG